MIRKEWIVLQFIAQEALRAVSREEPKAVRQSEEQAQRAQEGLFIAAGKVAAADGAAEESIAGEKQVFHLEADAARGMPRCMVHGEDELSEGEGVAVRKQLLRGGSDAGSAGQEGTVEFRVSEERGGGT